MTLPQKFKYRFIGLSGTNAAGKGEVAKILKEFGFSYYSLSDILRQELAARGQEASRENLIEIGNLLREQFGFAILAKKTREKLATTDKAVIDSIRSPFEAEELAKLNNFILLAVDAPIELRFARAQARGRTENASTLKEFIALENREKSTTAGEQQIAKVIEMADEVIINDGDLAQLKKRLMEKLL